MDIYDKVVREFLSSLYTLFVYKKRQEEKGSYKANSDLLEKEEDFVISLRSLIRRELKIAVEEELEQVAKRRKGLHVVAAKHRTLELLTDKCWYCGEMKHFCRCKPPGSAA